MIYMSEKNVMIQLSWSFTTGVLSAINRTQISLMAALQKRREHWPVGVVGYLFYVLWFVWHTGVALHLLECKGSHEWLQEK